MRSSKSFSQAFTSTINHISGKNYSTAEKAYQFWIKMSEREKNGIWEEVGMQCMLSTKQAHDFFHNKWEKQFCTCLTPYKPEIKEMVAQKADHPKKAQAVHEIIIDFQNAHKEEHFHYQTLY